MAASGRHPKGGGGGALRAPPPLLGSYCGVFLLWDSYFYLVFFFPPYPNYSFNTCSFAGGSRLLFFFPSLTPLKIVLFLHLNPSQHFLFFWLNPRMGALICSFWGLSPGEPHRGAIKRRVLKENPNRLNPKLESSATLCKHASGAFGPGAD